MRMLTEQTIKVTVRTTSACGVRSEGGERKVPRSGAAAARPMSKRREMMNAKFLLWVMLSVGVAAVKSEKTLTGHKIKKSMARSLLTNRSSGFARSASKARK